VSKEGTVSGFDAAACV